MRMQIEQWLDYLVEYEVTVEESEEAEEERKKEKKRKEKAGVGIPRGKPTGGESSCCGKSQESAQKNKGAINHEVYCPLTPLVRAMSGRVGHKGVKAPSCGFIDK